ncbi:MAG TPA: DUF5667 domain-containing protein [Planctomycetota bacterium]|nr:DUF5667 domain-containing protein [Planctomycetota bacterium]
MAVSLVLAGFLLGGSLPLGVLPVQEGAGEKPLLPGDSGYVLKRAREMVELSRCRDAEGRTDLVLRQAQERLREREALGKGPYSPEGAEVARGLGSSYRQLALEGGAGTIECGVAEGRDMKGVQKRYLDGVTSDHERWERVISALPPDDRAKEEKVLDVAGEAPKRSQAAEAAGLEFLKKERARREAIPAPKADRPDPPKPPPAPVNPPPAPVRTAPETTAPKPDPDSPRTDPDRSRKDDPGDDSRHPEHHPGHTHRPHH